MRQQIPHRHSRSSPPSCRKPHVGTRASRCTLHVACIQSNKRSAPHPEDSEQPRPVWKNPNDGLRLNPPRMRPVSSQKPVAADNSMLDWRSYRAKLVMMDRSGLLAPGCSSPMPYAFSSSNWAHELPAPEVGCLLVARQQGMDFFDKSVVLLAAHDPAHGSVGFVLNKPSPLKLSEVQLSATAKGILEVFGSQRLQLGGPVHMETLTLLHAFSGLAGAQKVSEGVFYGGLPAAVDLVRSGLAKPDDFSLMLGMTGWAPKQLDNEIAAGAWYVVAAGQGLALPHKQGAHGGVKHQGQQPRVSDASWRQMLQLIGRPVKAM